MSEEQQEVVIPGPGEILKKAREAAGLSTEDIASKIRLKNTLIQDIEQDNYDINISLTFIKGYLKLYAKQVDVSESEIVDAFEKHNTQKKEPAKLQSFSRKFSHQANDDKLMLVTYLIVAVVIALVVVWWFQQGDDENKVSSFLSNTSKTIENKISNQPNKQPEVETEPATELKNSSVISVIAKTTDSLAQETQDLVTDSTIDGLEPTEIVGSIDNTTELNPSESNEPEPEAIESASLTAQTAELDESEVSELNTSFAEPVELIFEFADNCWMNLADATGENIAYGVKVKGRVMPVTGIPPFEVTLGAPEVVKISYAGKPVDMSFIVPGRSAKFALPRAE
ncbi:DUF4115 domain-containing protein [Paraglaciecola aquimarina]|uniref:DUF4115 domain-containing protein n=1 Tax=Paraglaciecola algarum TaxID=3050085 RepID=A0ABS9D299_9ALTE|nr:RodZ domain-containing protein [Paraglaciecola sp. G1-23]MCF2946575.1 DUF4115 domain-containing protein [Paraglaciecola sp. G1-23]